MVRRLADLLAEKGHDVELFKKESSAIAKMPFGKVRAFFEGIYSVSSRKEIRARLAEFKPDIVQIQNLYPLISPSVLPEIKKYSVPIVMRCANYRLVCPNGLCMIGGKICEKCKGGNDYWCIFKNCEGSFLKSLGYAFRNLLASRTGLFRKNVTIYYTQTNFQKEVLAEAGFPRERIFIIPNMCNEVEMRNNALKGGYVAYSGRISHEKGISTFLDAAAKCSWIDFRIAGKANPKLVLKNPVPANVKFMGYLEAEQLEAFYSGCRFLVVPSICYEGFPSVIIEAMYYGKPIICSNVGGLSEIVEDKINGLLFRAQDPKDLADKIRFLWENEELSGRIGKVNREKVADNYSRQKYYERLMLLYQEAIRLKNKNG